MGFLNLLSWLADRAFSTTDDEPEITDDVVEMAREAAGESVTPEVLVNRTERSYRPILEYMEDDEQPEYVLRGGPVVISDADGTTRDEYPSRETQVVVSDRRVLIVMGGRISDDIWAVPLDDVVDAYVDDVERVRRYLIVEADAEDTEMTFFVDVSIEEEMETVRTGVAYIDRHGADR